MTSTLPRSVDIDALCSVMQRIAAGDFTARMERAYSGDEADVLAFLVNSLAEEVGTLVDELHREREELRSARDRIIEAEKLAALGLLAGGVAHEINQPLTVIQSLVALILMSPDEPVSAVTEDLHMIETATERMSRIVDHVRTFGRVQPFALEEIHPTSPVEDALTLLGDSLRQAGIRVDETIESELPLVMADVKRLEQVFVNLIGNARDALEVRPLEARRIEIRITTKSEQVIYEVLDSGPGIPSEIVPRIFDPFFTTKPPTRGTGLGLSVSLGIVQEHCGTLVYAPTEGGGSRFIVAIPRRSEVAIVE